MKEISAIVGKVTGFFNNIKEQSKSKINKEVVSKLLLRLYLSWILISVIYTANIDISFFDFAYFQRIKLRLFVLNVLLMWLLLSMIQNEKFVKILTIAATFVYAVLVAVDTSNFAFSVGCCLVMTLVIVSIDTDDIIPKVRGGLLWGLAVFLAVLVTFFVGTLCCLYYKNYWTSCYDFGLFAQMFHYMKETGLPLVTCERDGLLSHFAVHFSPIYYLILPIYWLIPSPCTLLYLQFAVVAVGIVPLIKICQNHKFTNWNTLLFVVAYLLYPCFTGSSFTYIHENNFLPALILWFIYYCEKQKTIPAVVFAILVMFVKEDAPVYVAIIALYFILTNKNYKCNVSIFLLSIVYFIITTSILAKYGDGVMTGRYSNYMYDSGDSLTTVFSAIIKNPAYVLNQMFTEEKLMFILHMLVPLAFLPLVTKDLRRFILLIPFILVNLMTNYGHQYSIGYQYAFGSGAILIYLAIINFADIKQSEKSKNAGKILLISACSSVIIYFGFYYNRVDYFESYKVAKDQRETIDTALEKIPDDASVSSSTFILPNLSQRDEIYQLESTSQKTEYYVLDLRYQTEEFNADDYKNDDFETVFYQENVLAIFRDKAY